jgi:hypothetical protein
MSADSRQANRGSVPADERASSHWLQRTEERALLEQRLRSGKPTLLYGERGAGKTRLLKELAAQQRDVLYIGDSSTPKALLHRIGEALQKATGDQALPPSYSDRTARALKGLVQAALRNRPWRLLLDHLGRPSHLQCTLIKDLYHYGEVPLIFAARTPHMEDVGQLQTLCLNKNERVELKLWPIDICETFASDLAEQYGLRASNLGEALCSIAETSGGSPGAIERMIQMAGEPKYHLGTAIKSHILHLDYLMYG